MLNIFHILDLDVLVNAKNFITINVSIMQYFGAFYPQPIVEICYDQRLDRGNKTMFHMSGSTITVYWAEDLEKLTMLNDINTKIKLDDIEID